MRIPPEKNEIETKVTLRFCRTKGIVIDVECATSGIMFAEINVPKENVLDLLSNMAYIDGTATLRGLDKIGKVHECKRFEFEFESDNWSTRKEEAQEMAKKLCPDGWEPDLCFSSQNSFFRKDGVGYAGCTIRRYT